MEGFDNMKKMLKGTILLFVCALVLSTFGASAVKNIGVTVKLPAFRIEVTGASGVVKETTSRQYFTTSVSKYTNSNSNALAEVRTYNLTSGINSDYVNVPVNQMVTIPNGDNVTLGVSYNLKVKNTEWQVDTVNFGGVWTVDK